MSQNDLVLSHSASPSSTSPTIYSGRLLLGPFNYCVVTILRQWGRRGAGKTNIVVVVVVDVVVVLVVVIVVERKAWTNVRWRSIRLSLVRNRVP